MIDSYMVNQTQSMNVDMCSDQIKTSNFTRYVCMGVYEGLDEILYKNLS